MAVYSRASHMGSSSQRLITVARLIEHQRGPGEQEKSSREVACQNQIGALPDAHSPKHVFNSPHRPLFYCSSG